MTPRPDTSWLANVTRSQMRGLAIDRKPQRKTLRYSVKLDFSRMVDALSSLECGNPVRFYETNTMRESMQIINAARMGAGLSMLRTTVRSVRQGEVLEVFGAESDRMHAEIQGLKS